MDTLNIYLHETPKNFMKKTALKKMRPLKVWLNSIEDKSEIKLVMELIFTI